MKYSDKVLYQVNYINSLLKGYNQMPIFENENFVVNEMSSTEYLKITFKKSNTINFDIICSSCDFQMNIDRTNEAIDLRLSEFDKSKPLIKDFLNFLFTCRIIVEYCGSNYTKIYFYDVNGNCIKTLKYITGLYLKVACQTKEYQPIYHTVP